MHVQSQSKNARVFGLDILRAIAVLLVLIGHSSAHQHPPEWLKWLLGRQGLLGVEIFYVLSGYLIGNILIRSAQAGRLHSLNHVLDFWQRRWARTLPLYYFFVLIYFRFDYLGVASLDADFPFLVFMQNFAWKQLPFFQHSWSLAVEEWFYFTFPILFLLFANRRFGYRQTILAACATVFVLSFAARIAIISNVDDWAKFDALIRSVVVCRLDSICLGVLLALAKIEWPASYAFLRRLKIPAISSVVAIAIYLALGVPGLTVHPLLMIVAFPVLSLFCALMIPGVEQIHSLRVRWLDGFISYTSKVSYSLYLGHICMLTFINGILDRINWHPASAAGSLAVYALYGLAYYGLATLTYFFVEQPYIRLRDQRLGHSDVRSGNVAVAT